MSRRKGSKTGVTSRGSKGSGDQIYLQIISREQLISSEGSSEVTSKDVTYTQYDPAIYVTVYDVILGSTGSGVDTAGVTYSSSDESVATVNEYGKMAYVSEGVVRIAATLSSGYSTLTPLLSLTETSETTSEQFLSWIEGSLAEHVNTDINNRINGLTPSAAIKIFTTQNHTGGIYVRNTGCWASGIVQQLTCISPWNSTGGATRAGTAISPRHIVYAEHYPINTGANIRFVTTDNIVVTKTLSNSRRVTGTDLRIGLLDSDLPASISYSKVAPEELTPQKLASINKYAIPALCLDQEEKALISGMCSDSCFTVPREDGQIAYYETKITGDSGNPAFLIVNDELMLLTTWTYGGGGSGPNISELNTEINAAMTYLGGGYQLTTTDLSGFPSY